MWLTRKVDGPSRSRLQALIRAGHVTVNGRAVKEHHKTRPGEVVALTIPPPLPSALIPEAIPLDILYEDNDLLVLNKPVGLVVHPAAGHASGTLCNALLYHCRSLAAFGPEQRPGFDRGYAAARPGIVHRLDRDTSGLMVVAKNERARLDLISQFKQRSVHKEYVAVVWGCPTPARGTIETMIGRHRTDRKKMAALPAVALRQRGGQSLPSTGRHAVTHYELMECLGTVALVRLNPATGRTHQLRVHLAHRGWPIVGDAQYGTRSVRSLPAPAPRQMLHAETLHFTHPRTGQPMQFTAPWPADLNALVAALRKPEPQPKQTPNVE
ncbi:MAG: RluA family pseudouridine synthase [Lentisphaerae bacterium]|nr:RluA family pseudouridine synthase [Lentisphaerota bacterium]